MENDENTKCLLNIKYMTKLKKIKKYSMQYYDRVFQDFNIFKHFEICHMNL